MNKSELIEKNGAAALAWIAGQLRGRPFRHLDKGMRGKHLLIMQYFGTTMNSVMS